MNGIDEMVDALEKIMSHGGPGNNKAMDEFTRSGKGELFILKYLYEKNAAVLPSELSEALGSSTSRISAALGSLEKKVLIHREIDTSNRRNILVTITSAGRERIMAMTKQRHNHLTAILTEMGEKNARDFVRLITLFFEISSRTFANMKECDDWPPGKP